MISYKLLIGDEVFNFQVKNGLFFCLRIDGKGPGVGFYIEESTFDEKKLAKAIQDSANYFKSEIKKLHLKLVGPKPLFEKWKRHWDGVTTEFVERSGILEYLYYPSDARIRIAPGFVINQESTVTSSRNRLVKVLIVDDSKTIRTLLRGVFAKASGIEVVADVGRPSEVIALIEKHKPDVITLDIHMPEMDGVTLLKKYINPHPIPTVMISSISMEEGPMVLSALEAGAVDYIKKPELSELAEVSELIIEKVKNAAEAKVKTEPKTIKTRVRSNHSFDLDGLIAIGSSTGGTEALREVLTHMPSKIPPILIVQHIPPVFSKAFANRLNELCNFKVKEAENGDKVEANTVYVAPGGKQMKVSKSGSELVIIVDDSDPVNRHKPSVDALFNSLAQYDFNKGVAVMLTGMGGDGAKGMLKLKEKGWKTIAQNKETCVVFGMPAVAIQVGAVQHVVPLDQISSKIEELLPERAAA